MLVDATALLRRMTEADLDAAYALSEEQKWPHRPEDWAMLQALGQGYVIEDDGKVVGTAMSWPFGDNAATVGMVIVSPACQGRGLGRALMDALLADLDGRTVMLNATAEGEPLYRKIGFAEAGVILQHQGVPNAVPVIEMLPGERVRPMGSKDLPLLRDLSRAATGMDRDAVTDAILADGQCVILTRDNAPVGFAIFRRFGRGYLIGPTIAPDAHGARVLINHWLAANASAFCRLDITEESGLGPWLAELGLPQVGRVVKMVRGAPLPAAPLSAAQRVQLFSLVSQALG